MTNRNRNSWSKKTKKGMNSLDKMTDITIKSGSFIVSEMEELKKNKKTKTQPKYTQNDWNFFIIFFVVFAMVFIGFIGVFSIFDVNFRGFFGLIKFFAIFTGALFVSGIITIFVSIIFEAKPMNKPNGVVDSEEDRKMINEITEFLIADNDIAEVENIYSKEILTKEILIKSIDNVVERFLDEGLLSVEKEERLSDFFDYFDLTQGELNQNGGYEKIVQSTILREVLEGEVPQKIKLGTQVLPFALNKNEKLIWISSNVNYYEKIVKSNYVGGSSGLSMKIANGLYYRASNFKGQRVETESLKYYDSGILGFTDKHIYFYSVSKSFRIPYRKIVILLPYENAIKLQKDGVTAKPQILEGISGWFAYNLIINLKNKN